MKTLLVIVTMLASSWAMAQEGRTAGSQDRYLLPSGWGEYFSITTGVMEQFDDETPTGGQPNSLKVLGSRQLGDSRWIADGGLGWQFHTLTDADRVDYDVINSLIIEAAFRYQFANRWELGGIIDALVVDRDRYGTTSDFTLFTGPTLMRDFVWADTDMRFGVSALRDINIEAETGDMVLVHYHLRFGGDPTIVRHQTREVTTAQK